MKQVRGDARREAILGFIVSYQQREGFAPSITDIVNEIGTARSNVHHHLNMLKKEGRLTSHPKAARSWVVRESYSQ